MSQQISPREELLKIQKSLWKRNNEIINNSIIVKEADFMKYERKYKTAVANYERVATHDEMLSAINEARLVYVGDYHTCNQSQRSFLRILKAVIPQNQKAVLGLELIHKRHQPLLDDFTAGNIDEKVFLKKIGLRQHWVFDLWANFKPLFDIAKYYNLPVAGIDAAGVKAGLRERDEATAERIVELLGKYPEHKLFVMIGDLHLAHLPEIVRSMSAGDELKDVILYQNSDAIYWKLAEQDLEHRVEVVKMSENEFCRMHTPPIVCQQSYINWLEHEEGEIDFSDSRTSFLELVDHISKFLEIDLGEEREKVDVYTCGDLSFFGQLEESGKFSASELKSLKRQILASESYFIAEKRVVYLANLSINHASEEAAHFIKHVCSGPERKRTPEDAFFANVLHEGLAFFGSKLINPKRKCFHKKEFESLIAYFETIRVPQDRRLEFETACIVLEFLKTGKRDLSNRKIISALKPDLFFSATHGLGYMIGDRLFYAMMAERVDKNFIRQLFYDSWREEGEALTAYYDLNKKLKSVKIPKRM
ncbi:MAG: ChaN family lipoprotein [Deltaproteobacteria bacterium]|nr:ChaN family lipoprotein [Deltaproteobacteria bacterium]